MAVFSGKIEFFRLFSRKETEFQKGLDSMRSFFFGVSKNDQGFTWQLGGFDGFKGGNFVQLFINKNN